ncbi:MAG TPA: hypothetical protein VH306_04230 [Gaiellaceae bacterium]|jgi:hypothetical protein
MRPIAWSVKKFRRVYDYALFVLFVAGLIALAVMLETDDKVVLLKIFAVGYFSLLPAILYLQFTSRKTPTVWREYVLTLFRLHADDYAHLPEPPRASRYYTPWSRARKARVGVVEGEGHEAREETNIYRRRFEELYGPLASERGTKRDRAAGLERAHKLQVLIATLLIALGWIFVVQPESVFGRSFTPSDFQLRGLPTIPEESIAFAFLGAYFFSLQSLVRRFFQNDLKATAYVSTTMRIIIVVLIVWVLDPVLPDSLGQPERSAIAFVIGVFPAVGWQALQSMVAVFLKHAVPSLDSKDPLSDLDGMNVWYEARLVEEGVEGIQNLATTDIGNALLRTRIPPERLIDWVDQAILHLHACDSDRGRLRRFGVRTATDLLDALAYRELDGNGSTFSSEIEGLLNADQPPGAPSVTRAIAVALKGERNLTHILAWKSFMPTPNLHEQELLEHALAAPGNGSPPAVEPVAAS